MDNVFLMIVWLVFLAGLFGILAFIADNWMEK